MKNLSFNEMAQVNGEGFLKGLCGGLTVGSGVIMGVHAAASYGLIVTAVPPLGTVVAVSVITTALTCGAFTILS